MRYNSEIIPQRNLKCNLLQKYRTDLNARLCEKKTIKTTKQKVIQSFVWPKGNCYLLPDENRRIEIGNLIMCEIGWNRLKCFLSWSLK